MPAILLLLALAAPPATAACAQALAAAPTARFCASTASGVALADTQAHADAMIADALLGEQRFRAAFAAEPSRYAIFSYDDPATIAATRAALKATGVAAMLPLPSPAFQAAQRARAAKAMAAVQAAGGKMIVRPSDPVGEPRDDRNHIPHELGHAWYGAIFWPAGATPVVFHYGSLAPDWLDEVAAMLMEDDVRTAMYRNRFADGRHPERAAGVPPEIPLAELVTMTHPAMAGLAATGPTQGPIRVTGTPSLFYAEARVLADYLIERSGDPGIFAAVTTGVRSGGGFADWLARDGARYRLPASLAAMDTDWQTWLTARYGPAV